MPDLATKIERPHALAVDLDGARTAFDSIAERRFFCWSNEVDAAGKVRKVPKRADGRANASSTDQTTWSPLAAAIAGCRRGGVDGPAVALGPLDNGGTLAGIDLDDVRDPGTGELTGWGHLIVDVLLSVGAYAEISPSGTGIKAFFTAAPGMTLDPTIWNKSFVVDGTSATDKPAKVECFKSGRYFAITGHRLPESVDQVGMLDQAAVERLEAAVRAVPSKGGKPRANAINSAAAMLPAALRAPELLAGNQAMQAGMRADLLRNLSTEQCEQLTGDLIERTKPERVDEYAGWRDMVWAIGDAPGLDQGAKLRLALVASSRSTVPAHRETDQTEEILKLWASNGTRDGLKIGFGSLVAWSQEDDPKGFKAVCAKADRLRAKGAAAFALGPSTQAACDGPVDATAAILADDPSDDELRERVAALSMVSFGKLRPALAKKLGGTAAVDRLRRTGEETASASAPAVGLPVEPCAGVPTTEEALTEIARTLAKHVVMATEQLIATVLWTAATHLADAVDVAPLLAVTSAEKRCGKSTLLTVLQAMVRAPKLVPNVTVAVIFRATAKRPTWLLDEVDTYLRSDNNRELVGVLNAGFTRATATVPRMVEAKGKFIEQSFDAFAFRALAGIGTDSLPDTLRDRSIGVVLKRRRPTDHVEQLRLRPFYRRTAALRGMLEAWAEANASVVEAMLAMNAVRIPAGMHDRQADCWEPLLAIAALPDAGDWGALAEYAAAKYAAQLPVEEDEPTGTVLLRHVHETFKGWIEGRVPLPVGSLAGPSSGKPQAAIIDQGNRKVLRVSSEALLGALLTHPSGRWRAVGRRGDPIGSHYVAKVLRGYDVSAVKVQLGSKVAPVSLRGWRSEDFDDAFDRYLS